MGKPQKPNMPHSLPPDPNRTIATATEFDDSRQEILSTGSGQTDSGEVSFNPATLAALKNLLDSSVPSKIDELATQLRSEFHLSGTKPQGLPPVKEGLVAPNFAPQHPGPLGLNRPIGDRSPPSGGPPSQLWASSKGPRNFPHEVPKPSFVRQETDNYDEEATHKRWARNGFDQGHSPEPPYVSQSQAFRTAHSGPEDLGLIDYLKRAWPQAVGYGNLVDHENRVIKNAMYRYDPNAPVLSSWSDPEIWEKLSQIQEIVINNLSPYHLWPIPCVAVF